MYEPSSSLISYLPLTLEWNIAALIFFVSALVSGVSPWVGGVMFLTSCGWCVAGAFQAKIDPKFQGVRTRLLVAMLIYLGPIVRSVERYRWRFKGLTKVEPISFDTL